MAARSNTNTSTGLKITGLKEMVRDLEKLGLEVADLKEVFGALAGKAARLAASFAPRKSGRLVASIKGSKAKNYASVKAGSKKVPYAAPINYGWLKRGIEPARFLQRADDAIRPTVQHDLDAAINRLIAAKGLG